jgi:hypothetical protein
MSEKRSYWLAAAKFLAFAILCVSISVPAFAQSTTDGAIGGTVTDPSGAVLPKAVVTVRNQGTNATASTTADAGGRFTIAHLQPGLYTLEITATGFGNYTRSDINVEVGRVTGVDVAMGIAAQKQTVHVTADAPVINSDQQDFSTNINQFSIANLPTNGRRWSTFALLTPGAAGDGNFGLISFRGISGLLNNNTVDGGDNNQAFFAEERGRTRIGYSISEDAIREFQVNTSNYSAEYGRSAGGVVNAVTKSGTNQFHGSVFYYIRDSALAAYNPFTTQTVSVAGTNKTVAIKPPDRRQQFGGVVGGPIFKDKLFFFFSYDQQKRNFPGVAAPANPTAFLGAFLAPEVTIFNNRGVTAAQQAAGLALLTNLTGTLARRGDQTIVFPKVDWNINSKHTFSANYNRLRWNSPFGVQTSAVVFRGVDSFGSDFVKDDWGIARLVSVITTHLSNEARFQYGRDFEFQNSQAAIAGEPVSANGRSAQIDIGPSPVFNFGKPNFLERRALPEERRTQFTDMVSFSWGRHLFRFGGDVNRVHDLDDNLFTEGGEYAYSNRVDFITDFAASGAMLCTTSPPPPAVGVPEFCYTGFTQGVGTPAFTLTTWDYDAFFQDDWRIHPRLTLNLGLRYEYEKMPDPQIPNPSLPGTSSFPDNRNNFGPRLGLAWDLTGKGKTILRGGYGIYYGRIINSTIFSAISATGVPASQTTLALLPTAAGAPFYPNLLPAATALAKDVLQFAPNTQLPKVHQFDLIFEHEFATNTAISFSYIGSLGRNLPIFVDTNLNPLTTPVTYTVSGGQFSGQTFTVPVYKAARPNANFGRITNISYTTGSRYNGLVVQLNRRITRGLQYQVAYTFSIARDDGQGSTTFSSANNILDPFNLRGENGTSNFDFRHRFVANAVWQPDYFKDKGAVARALFTGFTFSPVVSVSSGAPFTGTVSGNAAGGTSFGIIGAGGSNRPPFIPRNAFRLPHTAVVDFRISRRFGIKEYGKLEILGEAFNLFNHQNFTSVGTQIYSISGTTLNFTSSFGKPNNANNTFSFVQRQIQMSARFIF